MDEQTRDSRLNELTAKLNNTEKEVTRINATLNNGLKDRMKRIEEKLDTLLDRTNENEKRLEHTVDKDAFHEHIETEWNGRERRDKDTLDKYFTIGITILSVVLAGLIGWLL